MNNDARSENGPKDQGKGRGAALRKPSLRLIAWLMGAALLLFVVTDAVMSRTAFWFFQPWTGPLARENVKLTCVLRAGYAGDVVLVGDSRTRHDFVALAMEEELADAGRPRVMNLGIDAAQLIALREIVDRVMALPRPPRLVVIGVSAFNLNQHNTRLARDLRLYARPGMMWRGLVRCPDLGQKLGAVQGLTRGVETLFQLASLGRLKGICRLNEMSRGSTYIYPLSPAAQALNDKVQAYHGESSMRRALAAEVSRYSDEYMKEFSLGDFTDRVFLEMLDTAKAGGAGVIVVNMPESAEFRAATKNLGREEAEARFQKLCAQESVLFIDLNQDPLPPEAFFDYAVHLKPGPAIELSRRLARDAIRPAL